MKSISERLLGTFVNREDRNESHRGGSTDGAPSSEGHGGMDAFDTAQIEEDRGRSNSSRRVAKMSVVLAEVLDQPYSWRKQFREAVPLYDLGMLFVDDEILDKPGPLTQEEYEEVKTHTLAGAALLSGGHSNLRQMAKRIARSHHERWDGRGYPDGLEGTEIPLAARIVAVADTFEAMTHDRPYRDALPVESAFVVIEQEAGTQFDPRVSQVALERRESLSALI